MSTSTEQRFIDEREEAITRCLAAEQQQAKLRKAAQAVMDSVVPGTRSGRPAVSHDALEALASALAATTEDRSKK